MSYADIPIIPQGLRQEEAVVQTALALQYLNSVAVDMFKHIRDTVKQQNAELADIRSRATVVRGKLDKLAGTKKATKVLASPKYPGSDIETNSNSFRPTKPKIPVDFKSVSIASRHSLYDPETLKERREYFHIKSKRKQVRKNVEVTPQEGLGDLPPDLDSVSNLLLFNSSVNLYRNYVMKDPLEQASKTKQAEEEEVREDLEGAPLSLMQDTTVDLKNSENYFYAPLLEEVPQLNIPLDLPDLPGIADDLQFSTDSSPIAPSVTTPVPDLPEVSVLTSPQNTLPSPPMPPPSPTTPSAAPAPPPPPPPPPLELPPFPQEPTPVTSVSPAAETPIAAIPKSSSAGADARANLMEEIRKAGGRGKAKLVKVRPASEEKRDISASKQAGAIVGGDLMADLHQKLSLRRKGISGSNQAASNPLEKMLTMIPAPPAKPLDQEDADNSDSDWED